jgi:hypothetical protein
MPNPVEDIVRKLDRAHDHTHAFHRAANSFFKSHGYTCRAERDRNRRLVLRVVAVDDPPPLLGILIGEASYQLRSVLDHLMYLLAKPTTPKEERQVQFPLAKSRAEFLGLNGHRGTKHMMPGVPNGVRALVERLQPYHSRKWPQTVLLGRLREISNWDKHRTLATTATRVHLTEPNISFEGEVTLRSVKNLRGILKPGAVLSRAEVTYGPHGKVKMNPKLTVIPVFDNRMPKEIRGRPVISTLQDTQRFIEDFLPMFEQFL